MATASSWFVILLDLLDCPRSVRWIAGWWWWWRESKPVESSELQERGRKSRGLRTKVNHNKISRRRIRNRLHGALKGSTGCT